ncbi:hypothetical protein P5G51_012855 [Virgibacillus sp. 179-BFC.A HS]|uniref:Uncharacterized protein n=1 Tax=Tigheibacillus jepli TaxID=3035914 RepID=A0ABU5CIW0_9BACI|nr:hypothetical protein [Virgibacillus sp. 179-BFC.A HS]MDY0406160.1 hypothetical protein [Virgibacillus sp. 179-BFC.A HS]
MNVRKKKTLHVDKLTIKADQIFLEGPRPEPRRMSRDEFLFGRRRVEESTESGEQPVQRRRNPFLSGSVWGPEEEKGKESSSAEESRAEESKDSDEKKSQVMRWKAASTVNVNRETMIGTGGEEGHFPGYKPSFEGAAIIV